MPSFFQKKGGEKLETKAFSTRHSSLFHIKPVCGRPKALKEELELWLVKQLISKQLIIHHVYRLVVQKGKSNVEQDIK